MNILGKLMVAAAAASICVPTLAQPGSRAEAEVVAAARAQWAAERAGRPISEQMSSIAEDYTEFNADHPTRIDGKALNSQLYEAWAQGPKSVVGEMQNSKVQVYGDTAILTYNYVGLVRDKDGKLTPSNAKSTRVYNRQNGRWMLVHANFAPVSAAND